MTGTAPVLADEQDLEAPPPRRGSFVWSVIKGQPQATIGALVLLAFVLVALFAPVIAPYDPRERVGDVFEAPSSEHWRFVPSWIVEKVAPASEIRFQAMG